MLRSFGLEIFFDLRQSIKNPDILAYFGIFLRLINGKYQAKTDSSPREVAVGRYLFLCKHHYAQHCKCENKYKAEIENGEKPDIPPGFSGVMFYVLAECD